MIVEDFKGYMEGADITKIPPQNLAYPSKNVVVNKGKITTRGGLVNDGTLATVAEAVHSEFVWKDALGGVRPIRVHGQTVQVKYNSKWYTIYTALDADTVRVFFATWVDNNGSIVKKRLFFVDGSTAIYQWNGAIVEVESYALDVITIAGDNTLAQEGFDAGNVTTQTVIVYSLDGNGDVDDTDEYTYTNDPTAAQDLTLSTTPNPVPVAGDVVITKPTKVSDVISAGFDIDVVYSFKNHIVVANYNSTSVYFSHIETYVLATGLNFVMPSAGSRTALTPIFMRLDGNFTAMVARKNVLWISDNDDWYKVTKSLEVNAYSLWVDVEKFETGENKGALPMACAKYKGDIIYVAQDSTLQRVTSNEVLGVDEIRLISDDVEGLLQRVDLSDVRVYYVERAIYLICPVDSTMIILDLVEGYFQPPQGLPINCMSIIDGIKYGHHSAQNETYKIFSGRDDLDTPIEAIIAFGYLHGDHPLRYKQHTMIGLSARMTVDTVATVDQYFEEEAGKTTTNFEIDGSTVTSYAVNDDVSWATHPYADRSWAGADMEVSELRRVPVFSKFNAVSWFDFGLKITITGIDNEFHLLAWWIDEQAAPRKIGNDLFISK